MSKTKRYVADEFRRIKRVQKENRNNFKTNLKRFADYITEDDDEQFDTELEDSVHIGERQKS